MKIKYSTKIHCAISRRKELNLNLKYSGSKKYQFQLLNSVPEVFNFLLS